MSIFKNFFGKNQEKINSKINWIDLNNLEQLNEIKAISNTKPVVIFKHSTRCSVSRMVLKQFENDYNLDDSVDAYLLDLLEFRPISNEIAVTFNIEHQSPQLLLIKNSTAVYYANHESIDAGKLSEKI